MKKTNHILSIILAGILSASLTGCANGSADNTPASSLAAAEEVKEDIPNRDDFGTGYTMTAIFTVPVPDTEKRVTPTTSAFTYADITDCGELNTFDKKYDIPEISGDKSIEYFSPIICDKEISGIKYIGDPDNAENTGTTDSEHASETTVKVGDTEVKAYLLRDAGSYEVTVGDETLDIKVRDNSFSLYLDIINEMSVPNILINTESDDFKERGKEYDITIPALVKGYLNKYKDEATTLSALNMDNALFLKEYNRIRKLRGDSVMSADDMVKAYKDTNVDENKLISAPNRRGLKEKAATLLNITMTPEQKRGSASSGNTNNNNSNKNNSNDNANNNNANNNSNSNSGQSNSGNAASGNVSSTTGNNPSGSEAFALVNEYRAQYGLPPFSWGDGNVAAIRAQEIVTNFSHNSASGQQCYGENICMSSIGTARQAVKQWIESPPHRQNLLDPVCTRCAIACCYSGGCYWWSMNMWK